MTVGTAGDGRQSPGDDGSPATPSASSSPSRPAPVPPAADERCDYCGSDDTWWRNCKLLCRGCGSIVKSCADL